MCVCLFVGVWMDVCVTVCLYLCVYVYLCLHVCVGVWVHVCVTCADMCVVCLCVRERFLVLSYIYQVNYLFHRDIRDFVSSGAAAGVAGTYMYLTIIGIP